MKLRTSLAASCDGSIVDAIDENLIHDTACAHALMLAIENRVQRAKENDHLQEQVTLRGIKRFADELMREWGFDSTPEHDAHLSEKKSAPEHQVDMLMCRMVLNEVVIPAPEQAE